MLGTKDPARDLMVKEYQEMHAKLQRVAAEKQRAERLLGLAMLKLGGTGIVEFSRDEIASPVEVTFDPQDDGGFRVVAVAVI